MSEALDTSPTSPLDTSPGLVKKPSSYVYPVRSLLSGRIQPDQLSPPKHGVSAQDDTFETSQAPRTRLGHMGAPGPDIHCWTKDHTDAGMISEVTKTNLDSITPSISLPSLSSEASTSSILLHTQRRSRSHSQSSVDKFTAPPPDIYQHRHGTNRQHRPNYRHFPAEEYNSGVPRSFASRAGRLHTSSSPSLASIETISTGPGSLGEMIISPNPELDWGQTTQPPLSEFSNDANVPPSIPLSPSQQNATSLPFNPSEYGLVHLPPLPLSPKTECPQTCELGDQNSSLSNSVLLPYTDSHKKSLLPGPNNQKAHPESSTMSFGEVVDVASTDPLLSFRYEHAQDIHGNHVVIGREGELKRCEDEPIRTPGAVQAFGVLVAVEEMQDVLIVRQVSENSTELLGLPPNFLFSLECFTDTLPDSQAGLLWDNIQFLSKPESSTDERDEESPHVFLLSGWGAPGSCPSNINDGRIPWTCWCAVHRQISGNETSGGLSMIIMEFELERDTLNPLYPPVSKGPSSHSSPAPSDKSPTDDWKSILNDPGPQQASLPSSVPERGPLNGAALPENTASPPSDQGALSAAPRPLPGLQGQDDWSPSAEDILLSTTRFSKPLPALERLRMITKTGPASVADESDLLESPSRPRSRRGRHRNKKDHAGVGMMDVFAVMGQINEQLGAAPNLETFLKVVVGVIQDLTQFHRVLVYQFDESWNGQVVSELVDWSQTRDLYRGLHFPASDIPAQARALYAINKVRLLYDRSQSTARIVVKRKDDLETPLNMTHCYLRAMSPIHIKYLANMGVRASMSVSIMAFGTLWGLVTCHSYGSHGMRVSFPVRQMLRLLSQSISRNVERLSYAQRLHTRKLINTVISDRHPTGYIVSNADDLLGLFDADFGILVIGEGAKILGPNQHGQEILIMAEYLRLKQYSTIQASQAVINDCPDLQLATGFEVIAGLLYVPLSSGGKDFIAFLRKGQPRHVHWAGKPYKDGTDIRSTLEPRKSFKTWSEMVAGRCRAWTDEQLETAGVLALVYGKFIEVWRQKENALQTTKLTNLLLSNASHEVRTPLNHIINYLEMALNGPLDIETRDNLSRSHAASKSLLFTINDLLDLTRLESGNETSFNEPFDLRVAIEDATQIYRKEAERRNVDFFLELQASPRRVVGDSKKIRTVVQNLTANSLKYTREGRITVSCSTFGEPEGLRSPAQTAVEIIVADTGCGIPQEKLDNIFREFEQVESSDPKDGGESGVGLGLAVVARIAEQLGGQFRVDSKPNGGCRVSLLLPLALAIEGASIPGSGSLIIPHNKSPASSVHLRARAGSDSSGSEIESLVEALASNHMSGAFPNISPRDTHSHVENSIEGTGVSNHTPGSFNIPGSQIAVRPVRVLDMDLDIAMRKQPPALHSSSDQYPTIPNAGAAREIDPHLNDLRILIVEDNDINRTILAKRLRLDGHIVVNTTNGQEGLNKVESDRSFDAVLMDIQMPILNGFEATRGIRALEKRSPPTASKKRLSHELNGRIPIFAVSASLLEHQRDELSNYGMDGWILKPIDFRRLNVILQGVTDPVQRKRDVYRPGCSWESGGWLRD